MICTWTYVINLKIYTWPLGRATRKHRISIDVFHLNYMYMYLQIWFCKINTLCFSQILKIFNHIPVLFLWNKIIFIVTFYYCSYHFDFLNFVNTCASNKFIYILYACSMCTCKEFSFPNYQENSLNLSYMKFRR